MNREIKFRAWVDTEDEGSQMFKWNRHVKRAFGTFVARDGNGTAQLMQYTGMAEIDGREVYEGDIIQNRYGGYFLVEYDEQSARWVGKNDNGRVPLDNLLEATGQVVGNRFEDPELLEEVN